MCPVSSLWQLACSEADCDAAGVRGGGGGSVTSRSRFGDHTVRRKPVGCEVDKTQSPFVTGDGVWSKARRAVSWLSGSQRAVADKPQSHCRTPGPVGSLHGELSWTDE